MTAIDIVARMIVEARKATSGVRFCVMSHTNLELIDETFDDAFLGQRDRLHRAPGKSRIGGPRDLARTDARRTVDLCSAQWDRHDDELMNLKGVFSRLFDLSIWPR